jgi:hypothetical protein
MVEVAYNNGFEQPEPLEDVIADILDDRISAIHTAMPAKVVKYYPDTQVADCQPLIKSVRYDETGAQVVTSYPVLPRVPVVHPRGGSFFIHFPLAINDFVMLVFQESAIDRWRAVGGREAHPADLRKHALGNAVAYPGLYPTAESLNTTQAHAANLVIGNESGQTVHVEPGPTGKIRLGSSSEASLVALAELVDSIFSTIDTIFRTGWTPAPNDGGAALKTAWLAAFGSAPSSTAATRVTAL